MLGILFFFHNYNIQGLYDICFGILVIYVYILLMIVLHNIVSDNTIFDIF